MKSQAGEGLGAGGAALKSSRGIIHKDQSRTGLHQPWEANLAENKPSSGPEIDKTAAQNPLEALRFLLGEWEAIRAPGEATGGFTFESRLLRQAIVRANYSETLASKERPASRHEDLLVIYLEEAKTLRADYYDSEGHTIRYLGQVPAPGQVSFTSDPAAPGPGFRLTYRLAGDGILHGAFEISPPGQPGAFSPYLMWTARRVNP